MTVVHEKCTRSSAATVDRNVKYHSSQQKVVQSTVRNASRNTDHHAGTSTIASKIGIPFIGLQKFFMIKLASNNPIKWVKKKN